MLEQVSKKWRYRAAIGLGVLATWGAMHLIKANLHRPYAPTWLSIALPTAVAVAFSIYALGFGWLGWRIKDEFQKTGRLTAWYWGALLGLIATVPLFLFTATGGFHLLFPSLPFNHNILVAFEAGYLTPFLFQFGGYLIALHLWHRAR